MKIIINYDLINEIEKTRTSFAMRLVKGACKDGIIVCTSAYAGILASSNVKDDILPEVILSIPVVFAAASMIIHSSIEFLGYIMAGDITKELAEDRLSFLIPKLRRIGVNTDLKLLRQSEEISKKTRLKLSQDKEPYFWQEKYILVPTYGNSNEIKETYLHQERIGKGQYVLSVGSPKKQFKPAYASI
jgi:hypothetical protein